MQKAHLKLLYALPQDKGEFGSVSGKIEVDLKINHEGEVSCSWNISELPIYASLL